MLYVYDLYDAFFKIFKDLEIVPQVGERLLKNKLKRKRIKTFSLTEKN